MKLKNIGNKIISIGATVALGSVTKYSLSNSRRITLRGELLPLSEGNIFQGRTF